MKIIINLKQMHFKEDLFKFSIIYNIIPLKLLLKLSKKNIIFPFYHFVNDGENSLVNNLYKPKTKEQFIKDIQYLKKHFTSLSVKDLKQEKSNLDNFGFFLSFDDGLANFYKIVAPILLKEKIFCINFLNSNFIDNKQLFYRYKVNLSINYIRENTLSIDQIEAINDLFDLDFFNKEDICTLLRKVSINESNILDKLSKILKISFLEFLINKKPYLSGLQVLKLKEKGFDFGAHSKNHPRYSQISVKDQLLETVESVEVIKTQFNLDDSFFSFPFSDDGVKNDFFNKIKSKKITTFGSAGLKDEDISSHFQRIPMEYNSIYSAETIIKGELIFYIIKKILNKHKIQRD